MRREKEREREKEKARRIANSWEMYDIACRQAAVRSIEEVSWKRRSSDKNSHQSQAAACLSKFAFFYPFNQSKSVNREVWFVLFSHTVEGAWECNKSFVRERERCTKTTTRCEQDASFLTPLVHWSTVELLECFLRPLLLLILYFSPLSSRWNGSQGGMKKNRHQLLEMSVSVDGEKRRFLGTWGRKWSHAVNNAAIWMDTLVAWPAAR